MPPEPTAKRASAGGPAVDRLSTLPDGPLHTVLSFLPAPQLVRTCVLSRRWRDLWRSVPYINIDDREFGIAVGDSRDVLEEKWGKFEDFITNLLLFRDNTSSLDKFRLCAQGHNQRDVDRWIRRGIKYCPAVVDIEILMYRIKLPHLRSSFCRLKSLHLNYVSLDSNFAELLCSGCLVLEDLELENCNNDFQGITSPTLKKLVIDGCVNYTSHPLVITAPCLAYLCLAYGYYQNGISVYKMSSLVKASIHITESQNFPVKTQRSLLGSLFNVTSLELWGFKAVVYLLDMLPSVPPLHS